MHWQRLVPTDLAHVMRSPICIPLDAHFWFCHRLEAWWPFHLLCSVSSKAVEYATTSGLRSNARQCLNAQDAEVLPPGLVKYIFVKFLLQLNHGKCACTWCSGSGPLLPAPYCASPTCVCSSIRWVHWKGFIGATSTRPWLCVEVASGQDHACEDRWPQLLCHMLLLLLYGTMRK